jgi:hypothetical protein
MKLIIHTIDEEFAMLANEDKSIIELKKFKRHSNFVPKLEWFEKYEDGRIEINSPMWKVLGYESASDFAEDRRNERSTGWVERMAKERLPERHHHLCVGL